MYFFRKKSAVYITYYKDSRLVCLPRSESRHLDHLPDDQVKLAVKRLEALQGVREVRPDLAPCPDNLIDLIGRFVAHRASEGADMTTLKHYKACLLSAGVYMGWPLAEWPERSRGFVEWSKDMREWKRNRCRMYLLLFWKWAVYEGLATGDLYIRPVKQKVKQTPLSYTVTPEKVLSWSLEPHLKLLVLLGYFCSLRPQEIIALNRSDFTGGQSAVGLECCKVMASIGLYNRFAVRIDRQRKTKVSKPPKGDSYGWVACFDEAAAKTIVELVKGIEGDLFPLSLSRYETLWRRSGLGLDIKDLRRASLYWLGHYTQIQLIPLMNHARHKHSSTTLLYLRRPDSDVPRNLEL